MPDVSGITGLTSTASIANPIGTVTQAGETGGVWSANGGQRVAKGNSEMDKDTFLKLLVAQLKYQDPSKPTDSSQFMAQTAQFSMVEKLDALGKQNASLITAQEMLQGSALVGQQVGYTSADATPTYGVVSSVRFTSNGPVVHIGDTDVPIASVTEVRQQAAAAPAKTPAPAPSPEQAPDTSATPKD